MKDFCSDHWRAILQHNGLGSFGDLWSLECGWFEPPNQRRGGWSGVSRCELQLPAGGRVGVFLKRQENHVTHTLLHPFGMPTSLREMRNMLRFKRAGLPAPEPVYFAVRKTGGNVQAILVTEELAGYESLNDHAERWSRQGWPDHRQRRRLMQAVATAMRRMHKLRIQHDCLYPKHVLLRFEGNDVRARIIDLEKARVKPLRRFAVFRDLFTLNHLSAHWSRTDRLRFLLTYLELDQFDAGARRLWRRIAHRNKMKVLSWKRRESSLESSG